jgi:glycosyltransferase involved in cell wall biosynthesis
VNIWILADVARSVPGGMKRHMELHAEGLLRLGHRATTFFAEDFQRDGGFPIPRRLRGLKTFLALRERYNLERPDVINVHTQCAPAWIVAARTRLVKARIVVMSYAADEAGMRVRGPRDLLRWANTAVPARGTFPLADGIWCVNRQDLEYYVSEYGVRRERLVCLPHAVGDAFYSAGPPVNRRRRQILFVGSFIHRKGSDILGAILAGVLEQIPDADIVLAGTLSGEENVRRALPVQVSERTRILDSVTDEELVELYRTSSLLLLPSRREGLPIAMLEAMACGCPPLTAANSGMLDVIEPGKNGWLEVSFDPERWSARIVDRLNDPASLARAGEGAQRTAEAFRVETAARGVLAWYEGLARRNP